MKKIFGLIFLLIGIVLLGYGVVQFLGTKSLICSEYASALGISYEATYEYKFDLSGSLKKIKVKSDYEFPEWLANEIDDLENPCAEKEDYIKSCNIIKDGNRVKIELIVDANKIPEEKLEGLTKEELNYDTLKKSAEEDGASCK